MARSFLVLLLCLIHIFCYLSMQEGSFDDPNNTTNIDNNKQKQIWATLLTVDVEIVHGFCKVSTIFIFSFGSFTSSIVLLHSLRLMLSSSPAHSPVNRYIDERAMALPGAHPFWVCRMVMVDLSGTFSVAPSYLIVISVSVLHPCGGV